MRFHVLLFQILLIPGDASLSFSLAEKPKAVRLM